mgnify:CR=1 FL=1
MTFVGLIPARAGSRRLVGKNLIQLGGRPLIAYTCDAAVASGVLAAVYVNTDSPDIARVAREFGAECPVLRPPELAQDDTPMAESNRFLLNCLAERGEVYDAAVVLQPTSPLRTPEDIRGAVEVYETNAPCSVVSVSPVAPAGWLGYVGRGGRFERLAGEEMIYRLNGAIYVYHWADYISDRAFARTLVYPMPARRGVDIDTLEDLRYAEFLLQQAAVQACV